MKSKNLFNNFSNNFQNVTQFLKSWVTSFADYTKRENTKTTVEPEIKVKTKVHLSVYRKTTAYRFNTSLFNLLSLKKSKVPYQLSSRKFSTDKLPSNKSDSFELVGPDGKPLQPARKPNWRQRNNQFFQEAKKDWSQKKWNEKIKIMTDIFKLNKYLGGPLIAVAGATYYAYKQLNKHSEEPIDNLAELPRIPEDYEATRIVSSAISDKLGKLTDTVGVKFISITGPHGAGKSTLAQIHAEQFVKQLETKYKDNNLTKTVFWLDASTDKALERDFRRLAQRLNVPVNYTAGIEEIRQKVEERLGHRPGWILVFDQVENYQTVQPYIQVIQQQQLRLSSKAEGASAETPISKDKLYSLQGKIILTSQRSLAADIGEANEIVMNGLDIIGAKQLLGKWLSRELESDREALVLRLAKLPLALKQACSYIKKNKRSIRQYLNELEPHLPTLQTSHYMAKDAGKIYTAIIETAWKSIVNDRIACDLIKLCSLFATSPIPDTLLKGALAMQMHMDLDAKLAEVLELLENYGLLERFNQHSSNTSMIHIPAITQSVINAKVSDPRSLLQTAIFVLSSEFHDSNLKTVGINKRAHLIGHAEAVIDKADQAKSNDVSLALQIARLKLGMAIYYSQTGAADRCASILMSAQHTLESSALNGLNNKKPQEICQLLARQDRKLPTLYANVLYQLCRTYFNRQENKMPDELKWALDTAIGMREEIDTHSEKYNDEDNKDGYSFIYLRHGKALSLIIEAEQAIDPEIYLKNAEDLLLNIRLKNGEEHEAFCDELLVKIALQRAKHTTTPNMRKKFLDDAYCYLKGGQTSQNLTIKRGALAIIQNKDQHKQFHREGKFHNLLGHVYLARNNVSDRELALQSFKACLTIPQPVDFPLADAHFGLAKIYYQDQLFDIAKEHIDQALNIYVNILHRPVTHHLVKEAFGLQHEINFALAEEQQNEVIQTLSL